MRRGTSPAGGVEGESLFFDPFMDMESNARWNALIPDVYATASKLDDRASAIMLAIVVEQQLDLLLSVWMPKWEAFCEAKSEVTFSVKIGVLRAASIVPNIVPRALDAVRAVRNKFAHDFSVSSFERLPEKELSVLRGVWDDTYARWRHRGDGSIDEKAGSKHKTNAQLFRGAVDVALIGVAGYRTNLRILREAIEAPEFQADLEALAIQKLKADVDAMVATAAKSAPDTGEGCQPTNRDSRSDDA